MVDHLNFPDKIVKVTQEDIKDHLFESTRCFKSKYERRMITNEKFAEVLKSLTKDDFDAVQKLISNLISKFDDLSTRELFTEVEKERISNLIESYPDEVGVALLACKFKE